MKPNSGPQYQATKEVGNEWIMQTCSSCGSLYQGRANRNVVPLCMECGYKKTTVASHKFKKNVEAPPSRQIKYIREPLINVKNWAIQHAAEINQNENKFADAWAKLEMALADKYSIKVLRVYKSRARNYLGFKKRAHTVNKAKVVLARFEKATRAALDSFSADKLEEEIAVVAAQRKDENVKDPPHAPGLDSMRKPSRVKNNPSREIKTKSGIKSLPPPNSKFIECYRLSKMAKRKNIDFAMSKHIVKESIQKMAVRRKPSGGKPTKYPSLRKLPVAEMTEETITGECVCVPYSKANYTSLYQACRHLMSAHDGWKFTVRKVPAKDGQPELSAAWRVQ